MPGGLARSSDALDRAIKRIGTASYLRKWCLLGVAIGVVAGLGAVVFVEAIHFFSWLLLGVVGGYTPPSAASEGNALGSAFARPWAVPLVVGLGGLLSGMLVERFAPEAEGHGTDTAIDAVHRNPRGMRARASLVKIVASAVTIGSGGSAGREGPTAQISAGFASMLARRLDLTPTDARIALTAGIGSGIGAVFRAPLGGAVLGAEILYRDDLEAEALFPSFVASIIGFSIFAAFQGFSPIFGYLRPGHLDRLQQLPFYAVIGVAAGLLGLLYAKTFYGAVAMFHRAPGHVWLKTAIAGVMVGSLGLLVPGALGTGYGWLQRAMTVQGLNSIAVWMILALPFAKILATSLTIGSGGSGGIFGPGMVIGGFVGASIWTLASGLAGVPASPVPFVVVGMTACFGSVAHAPLAMILMVAEMTGTLELILPAMIAIGIASLIVGDVSIYEHQLKDRAASPGHRFRAAMPLLASVPVAASMEKIKILLQGSDTSKAARRSLSRSGSRVAAVINARGTFTGTTTADALDAVPDGTVADALDATAPSVPQDATLEDAVEGLAMTATGIVPVLDDRRSPVGVVTSSGAIDGYRRALVANLQDLGGVPPGTGLMEVVVGERSAVVGVKLANASLPPGTVVIALRRGSMLVIPGGDDEFRSGDDLTLLAPVGTFDRIRVMFEH